MHSFPGRAVCMQRFLSAILGASATLGVVTVAHTASATRCANSTSHACWANPEGSNMAQVAVGASGAGKGIACAVLLNSASVHCYEAYGTSGATTRLYMGQEANSPYFNS